MSLWKVTSAGCSFLETSNPTLESETSWRIQIFDGLGNHTGLGTDFPESSLRRTFVDGGLFMEKQWSINKDLKNSKFLRCQRWTSTRVRKYGLCGISVNYQGQIPSKASWTKGYQSSLGRPNLVKLVSCRRYSASKEAIKNLEKGFINNTASLDNSWLNFVGPTRKHLPRFEI